MKDFFRKKLFPEKYSSDYLRDQWVEIQCKRISVGEKILDLGAGQLRNKKFCNHLNYVSQDFCQYDGKGNDQGLQTSDWDVSKIDIVSDIIDIPIDDASIDNIICTEVLEHIPYPELAIKEMSRIVKKGGYLILTAPFMSETHFAPYHFCSGFDKYWYDFHLKENGFDIIKIEPYGNMYSKLVNSMRIIRGNSKNYGVHFNFISKGILILAEWIFNNKINCGNSTAEVSCYGYNVLARKR